MEGNTVVCEEIRELLEAHAVGALGAQQQDIVEHHLEGCLDCRRLAREYAEAVATLPQALALVSPMRPPASVKDRLMRSLEALPDEPAAAQTFPLPSPSPSSDRKRSLAPSRWQRWLHPSTAAAVAAAALIVLSLAWGVGQSQALAKERALRSGLADLVGQQELVLEVVDSSNTRKVALRPPHGGSPAYGKIFTRPDLPDVVVMAAKLPQPPPGQVYRLWLRSGVEFQAAGTLVVDSKGFGMLVFKADHNGPTYEAAELSLQPEGSTVRSDFPVLVWVARS